MKNSFFTITLVALFLFPSQSRAQTNDRRKLEAAGEFTSITMPDFDGGHTEPGLGARLTYNLKKSLAVEAAGYFFPHKCHLCTRSNAGKIGEGLFGVKAGKRFEKWGIFGKARPGLISFSEGASDYVLVSSNNVSFERRRLTNFAFDLGVVIEFYPSKRIVTRFDAGDTLIHYGRRTNHFLTFDSTGAVSLFPFTSPASTRHNFQFNASVGFRF
jgi:hypothetical protein